MLTQPQLVGTDHAFLLSYLMQLQGVGIKVGARVGIKEWSPPPLGLTYMPIKYLRTVVVDQQFEPQKL
jgi:hypothetical protein